jgi:hypothetical protein
VYIERMNWWEGAEVQIPLTNENGSADTSGLAVYNSNYVGTTPPHRVNTVDIAGSVVLGDIPGATRIEMVNAYPDLRLNDVWIGQLVRTSEIGWDHYYEAEATTFSGTVMSGEPTASNNAWAKIPLASGTETTLLTLEVPDEVIDAAAGRYFKLMARFHTNDGLEPGYRLTRFRVKLLWNGATIWQSALAAVDTAYSKLIRDLATFQLPPWLPGVTDVDGVDLQLTGYQTSGEVVDIGLDYLQLVPVDGWRYLRVVGFGVTPDARVVDDGISGYTYREDAGGTARAGIFAGYGNPITLHPGKDQRLYFLLGASGTNVDEIDRYVNVKMFHRPRRRVL